jgi:hypothetical protein
MLPSEYEIARAERAGRFFARANKLIKDCPFNADGTGAERVLAVHFVRGYLQVRPAGGRRLHGLAAGSGLETVRLAETWLRAQEGR